MRTPHGRFLVALLLAGLVALPQSTQAQTTRMGVHAGLNLDGSNVLIGLNGQFGIDISDHEAILGITGELYPFMDKLSMTVVEIDALLPFRVSVFEMYGGGGLALRMRRFEDLPADSPADESDTDLGVNLKAGLVYGDEDAGMRPYVEVDQTLGAGTDLGIRVGIFFILGSGR